MLHEIESAAGHPSTNAAYVSHSKKYAATYNIMQQIYVVPFLGSHKYVKLVIVNTLC